MSHAGRGIRGSTPTQCGSGCGASGPRRGGPDALHDLDARPGRFVGPDRFGALRRGRRAGGDKRRGGGRGPRSCAGTAVAVRRRGLRRPPALQHEHPSSAPRLSPSSFPDRERTARHGRRRAPTGGGTRPPLDAPSPADPELGPRERGALVRALCDVDHLGPDGRRVEVSAPTVRAQRNRTPAGVLVLGGGVVGRAGSRGEELLRREGMNSSDRCSS